MKLQVMVRGRVVAVASRVRSVRGEAIRRPWPVGIVIRPRLERVRDRLDDRRTLRAMDGLGQAVGDGISGLVGGALNGITAAISGMVDALGEALPSGALPVIGIALVFLLIVAVVKR